jgi:hypothetical protein
LSNVRGARNTLRPRAAVSPADGVGRAPEGSTRNRTAALTLRVEPHGQRKPSPGLLLPGRRSRPRWVNRSEPRKTRPPPSSRASASRLPISPRAMSDSTCSGSLRSGTRSRMPACSVQRYIRVSAASTAAWSSSANSTKASVERKSASQDVRPERFAWSISGSNVVRARSVLPRPASTNERRRKGIVHGPGLELSDCGARVRRAARPGPTVRAEPANPRCARRSAAQPSSPRTWYHSARRRRLRAASKSSIEWRR